jgi:hypothetical protein
MVSSHPIANDTQFVAKRALCTAASSEATSRDSFGLAAIGR